MSGRPIEGRIMRADSEHVLHGCRCWREDADLLRHSLVALRRYRVVHRALRAGVHGALLEGVL
ncbi:hypothetical protein ACFQ36_07065 [Arthrobacter sp. GCM10027362]|uniref:hypothetical protein n=1 Tax=Arthrobacter sp. GCM10027362 TaxID=3273379 RepID=UPI00364522FE